MRTPQLASAMRPTSWMGDRYGHEKLGHAGPQSCRPQPHDRAGVVGLQIDAKRSMPQNQKPKMRKLFVGGLAPETTEGGQGFVLSSFLPGDPGPCNQQGRARKWKLSLPVARRGLPGILWAVRGGDGGADHAGPHKRAVARLWVSPPFPHLRSAWALSSTCVQGRRRAAAREVLTAMCLE